MSHGQAPAKTPSFFDLVYNYFTEENNKEEEERERERKEEAEELKTYKEIKERFKGEANGEQQKEESMKEC